MKSSGRGGEEEVEYRDRGIGRVGGGGLVFRDTGCIITHRSHWPLWLEAEKTYFTDYKLLLFQLR